MKDEAPKEVRLWKIPSTWAWAKMGEIATVVGGGTPRTDDPSNFDDGEIAWITPADLSGYSQKKIERGGRNITEKGLNNSGATMMPAGTVLFSSRAPIGYVAIAANPVSTNQGFKSFIPGPAVSSDFLYYYLQFAKPIAREMASGTTFLEISGAKAAQLPVPVAPLAEQGRIVAEIEKQFTRLDAATAALKRVQANLKRYRASVLKAACEGCLVPTEAEFARREGRDYEPADQLLQRILRERRARWEAETLAKMIASGKPPKDDHWKQKYKDPSGPDRSALPALPGGWCWASVDQLGFVQLGRQRSPENRSRDYPTPYLRAANITERGLDLSDVLEMEFDPSERERFGLKHGDVVLSEASGSADQVGKPAIWREELPLCCFQNTVLRLQPSGVSSEYLLLAFRHFYENGLFAQTAGGVGINHLSAGKFSMMPVPVPPTAEQDRIVEVSNRALSIIENLLKQSDLGFSRAASLRTAVLQRAFSGKLVKQQADDEPASLLLERIRVEQKAATPAPQKVDTMTKTRQRVRKPLVQELRDVQKALTPEELFSSAGFEPDVVDEFYAELQVGVRDGLIEEIRKGPNTVLLRIRS